MNAVSAAPGSACAELVAALQAQRAREGRSLEGLFYRSPEVYRQELQRIVFRSWLYAGHASEIPLPGDFLQYEIGDDALILSRAADGRIHAFANTCRHRGARVCAEARGNTRSFVCPYHGWVYNGDGSLRSARHMDADPGFRPAEHGLRALRTVERHGLVFVNADPGACDFGVSLDLLEPALGPHRLGAARIAHRECFRVAANWKLVLENYLECYHCASSHHHYARAHSLKEPRARTGALREAMLARSAAATGAHGLGLDVERSFLDAPGFGADCYAWRHPLYEGFLSGSRDGAPLAPLLGELRGYDGGASDFAFGPLCFMLAYPDHAVLFRFTPRGIAQTDMDLQWFVRDDALEGRDFRIEDLAWLWHQTSLEDEHIILRNAAGVGSQLYQPGPLQPEFEYFNRKFIAWYLAALEPAPAAR